MFWMLLDNWYEDRLAIEQEYKKDPEKRMVSKSIRFCLYFWRVDVEEGIWCIN